LVLLQLRKAGSDLSKPHKLEFFLYFVTECAAEEAALRVRNTGFDVEVKEAAEGEACLCFATKTMVPDLIDLQRIRDDFVTLAAFNER